MQATYPVCFDFELFGLQPLCSLLPTLTFAIQVPFLYVPSPSSYTLTLSLPFLSNTQLLHFFWL